METWYIPKELILFFVVLKTVPLYISWDQFIPVQVTLQLTYNQMPLNAILVKKYFSQDY